MRKIFFKLALISFIFLFMFGICRKTNVRENKITNSTGVKIERYTETASENINENKRENILYYIKNTSGLFAIIPIRPEKLKATTGFVIVEIKFRPQSARLYIDYESSENNTIIGL